MRTLEAAKQALRASVGSDLVFNMVATRIFLATGVNLKDIRPVQNADPALLAKVVGAARDAGFALP